MENQEDFEKHERIFYLKKQLEIFEAADVEYSRFGSTNDGGYILVNDLVNDDYLLSMGVEGNVDFEKDLSKIISGMDLYDFSVSDLPEPINNSIFFQEKIGLKENGDTDLSACLERISLTTDLIWKMDIEGGELDILPYVTEDQLNRFRQIVIEFHDMDRLESDMEYYNKVLSSLISIRRTHTPVLVHPNNNIHLIVIGNSPVPPVFEVLYLRNSSYSFKNKIDPFKNLIARNNLIKPEIGLTFP